MNKIKLLICGGTGFIGRNLVEHFSGKEAFEVYATHFHRESYPTANVKWIQTNLNKREDIEKAIKGMDIIIQAAATTSGAKDIVSKPYYHVTDNAVMNSILFRAAFEHNIKHIIFFSCTVMYPSSEVPLKETDFDANTEIYSKYFGVGWTKVYIEKMCEFYSRVSNTKYTAIRHSNIYGPHDKFDLEKSHVFGATMTKVLTNTSGEISVWGTGEEERDLLYITDLIDFVEAAIQKQQTPFELVNVGLGKAIAIRDLVKKIVEHSKKEIMIRYDTTKPTIKTKLCLDTTKAKQIFGWQPQITLDEGIKKTIKWYNKNI